MLPGLRGGRRRWPIWLGIFANHHPGESRDLMRLHPCAIARDPGFRRGDGYWPNGDFAPATKKLGKTLCHKKFAQDYCAKRRFHDIGLRIMTKRFDKSKLPSRYVSVGVESAPHRSYYYAMGLTEEEIARPFVGIASAGNDSAPCNTTLDQQADWCRQGVNKAGGMPRRFNTITVTDGIAMGHQGMKSSLVSREVIADSVELSVRGHCYDALVTFAGCDKSLPGMMMAMVRLNIPSVFMYGGSILPGKYKD